ncbi:zinc-binding dehydrogenase, partial [Candidatus Bipolaricaulota bacterium]|nr:zinc-binding dehydrogenase [Candidatus Bipolaricaulota bacterium]
MKAIQLVEIGRPLEAREVPIPEPGRNEILVRVQSAGICRSDVHYRSGLGTVGPLPHTPGHEVAGIVEKMGSEVAGLQHGQRVALHYLVTCGECSMCRTGREQFCPTGRMIGKDIAGGYAEVIVIPARNAMPLPDKVSIEHGAVLMCSTATVFHALRRGRLAPGERVAVVGVGGLGLSAVQLALIFGATEVFAIDIDEGKLETAAGYGAIPIHAATVDPVEEIARRTGGGVDLSLELIGLPQTMRQSVEMLGVQGRAVMVGLASDPLVVDTYQHLLAKEAEIIGCSDHLISELPIVIELARQGKLDLTSVVACRIPLEAAAVNGAFDELESFSGI